MSGEPVEPPPSPEDSDPAVALLQRQMVRLKRWFAWERWLMEPRSFDPPDDPPEDEPPARN
jgi:hypothetical protein